MSMRQRKTCKGSAPQKVGSEYQSGFPCHFGFQDDCTAQGGPWAGQSVISGYGHRRSTVVAWEEKLVAQRE
ncbi:hypothetical protein ACFX13_029120 [Malus domestica]